MSAFRDNALRKPDEHSEARLAAIRNEAAQTGRVQAAGVSIPGAPFPIASPETGYYGIHLLKQPQWTWEIPLYFFVGGAAGASAVIGAVAHWSGRDPRLARDARYVAAGGAVLSSALLIGDLGKPSRFLYMLRMLKPQSPMSVGAWTLAVFGATSSAAAAAQFAADELGWPVRWLGNIAEVFSLISGLPFSNYTGVLIGATAVPVWNHNIKTLPVHFGMSGLNAGVGTLELLGHHRSAPLNALGIGAAAMETYEGIHLEFRRDPEVNSPLKRGVSGWITRVGGVLSGPVPVALRLASLFASPGRSRKLRRAAAAASIAGSLLTRVGWIQAGHASAKDWRVPLQAKRQSEPWVQDIPQGSPAVPLKH